MINTETQVYTKFEKQDLILASRSDSQVQQWTHMESAVSPSEI